MPVYALSCLNCKKEWEEWFSSYIEVESISCRECGKKQVRKLPTTISIGRSGSGESKIGTSSCSTCSATTCSTCS
jgi:putative FmdB family regulatory protein